jgi:ATP-dependent helicase HrpA
VTRIHFPEQLPISARVKDIHDAIASHQVVIVAGATGSGKTTQLPKIAMGFAERKGLIGVTQPRRIAATSVAARVAQEVGTPLGTDVGYQIRFEDRTTKQTAVKFMTDGILLAEIQGARLLRKYSTLIIDEAHERSLTIDFLLGWIKRILPERKDLKVVVSSATIETERFSAFFGDAPVIQVEGRTFPVDVLYEPPNEDDDLPAAVAHAVSNVCGLDPHGDILVFLPGEREIREAEREIVGRNLKHTVVQPLYARLSAAEQSRVFASIPQRRVILATNVAETSITLPGIVYVVDTGMARLARYEPRSGTTRLQIEAISQASAEQRKGRCGRVREGICVRLYDEESFVARPAFTDPEIKRTGLAAVILRMKSLGLGAVEDFPFLDPPSPRSISEGYKVLEELGALDEARNLTKLGEKLARFPVDPRISRMILTGSEFQCLQQVLIITAALNSQDPRERPREVQQKADDLHRRFTDERSDFIALLKIWDFVKEAERKSTSHLRRVCRDNFLSYNRVREWFEVHRQLQDVVRELGMDPMRKGTDEAVHKALLSGLLSKIGMWVPEKRVYMGSKQTRFAIHPSSAVAKKPPQWVMAFELVETSQLFARMVAKIDPEWIMEVAPDLVKRSYSEAHWSEKAARASVKETCTLFGLTVARDRSVDYASISPEGARRMFIDYALVRGEYKTRAAFHDKNRALFTELEQLRDKARRSNMLANDEAVYAFFDKVIPASVVNGKTFDTWRERAEHTNPTLLHLTLDDLLIGDGELSAKDYPDHIELHGTKVAVSYLFDPSAADDGITLTIPLVLLPQLQKGELDWTIPGWHRQKIEALLDSMTKAARRELGSTADLARTIAAKLRPFHGPMLPLVAQEAGVDVASFRPETLVPHLKLTANIVDEHGKVVAQGREVDELIERYGAKARATLQQASAPAWEKRALTSWSFGALPAFITRRVGGVEVRSYPALVDRGANVDLVLLESPAAAEEASRAGIRRLFMIAAKSPVSTIVPRLPPAFARPNGPFVRADDDAFRTAVLARVIDMAFGIERELPRDKDTFDRLVKEGTPRVNEIFQHFATAIAAVAAELNKTLQALHAASKHPSGKLAIADIYAQLEALFVKDFIHWISLEELADYPRYLKAAQARLSRAINDPRKDSEKLAPFTPLWTEFLARKDKARALRWSFEELRIAIFAPELKAKGGVSVQKVKDALRS